MALIDKIKQKLAAPVQAAPTDEQAAAEAALGAKSGKAAVSGAPRASRVGEAAGAAQTAAQLAQIQQQGAAQAVALGAQQEAQAAQQAGAQAAQAAQARQTRADVASGMAEAGAKRQAAATEFGARLSAREREAVANINYKARETLQQLATDRGVAESDLFATFAQGKADMAHRQDLAKLDQATFQAAMANKAYVDNLLRVGQERRLSDQAAFELESRQLVLGENLANTMAGLQQQLDLDADETEFQKQLADMNFETAMQIAAMEAKDRQMQMVSEGVGKVSTAVGNNPTGASKGLDTLMSWFSSDTDAGGAPATGSTGQGAVPGGY